ncbi:MAG: baseplate J/gp47 family protein, partial [Eubacterium sp.]|nr:baseplate J/gp47 family protein [Eubacterium sp.]
ILNSMKAAFECEKGESVKALSDLEARFKAVASEIYSVSAYGDYILKQSFPQTATGEFLDRHAALRSITRKTASYAKGTITVYRTESSLGNIMSIPKGTIFSVSDKPFIQFATDKAYSLSSNASSVSVSVTALKTGSEYNIKSETVFAAVNPPAYLERAVSNADFSGGWDAESDEALRERILSSYGSRKNAVSAEAVRETLLTLSDVTDAVVFPDENYRLNVCLKTKNGKISTALKNEATDMLGFATLCGVTLVFTAAAEQPFDVTVEAKILSGYSVSEIENKIKERVKAFCSNEKIGQNYSESAIAAYCSGIDGVEYLNVFLGSGSIKAVACGSNQFLKLNQVEVYTHE